MERVNGDQPARNDIDAREDPPRFAVKPDLGAPEETAPEPPDAAAILRTVARRVRWYRARRVGACVVVVLMFWSGHTAANDDQRLIDTQPHQTAVVVRVHDVPFDRTHEPDVTVELDNGRRVALGLSFPGDDHVKVGDRLLVVQDPDDPSYVITINSHNDWAYSLWGEVALSLAIGAGLLFILFLGIPKRMALRAAHRVSGVSPMTIESVVGQRLTLRDDAGRRWQWRVDEDWDGPHSGSCLAVGDLKQGGWVLLSTGDKQLWWPDEPIQRTDATADPGTTQSS